MTLVVLSGFALSIAASVIAGLELFRDLNPGVVLAASAVLLLAAIVGEVAQTAPSKSSTPAIGPISIDALLDELALTVRSQWRTEERLRRVRDPYPLPVRWTDAPMPLVDHWENVRRSAPGVRAAPLHLGGSLEAVSKRYLQVPSGRLVVLGAAGAGKTVLGIRLLLDLLADRGPGEPVAVVVNLHAWNPASASFHGFIATALTDAYPALASSISSGQSLASILLETDRLVLVLDGFDEMNSGLHSTALRELSTTTCPLILLSRTDPYIHAVRAVAPLSAAAVVVIEPLAPTEIAAYLPRTADDEADPPGDRPRSPLSRARWLLTRLATRSRGSGMTWPKGPAPAQASVWHPVVAELTDHPRSTTSRVITESLSTPLMVSLARVVYGRGSPRHPRELLDAQRFPDQASIERHLLAHYVTGVYAQSARESAFLAAGTVDAEVVASRAELALADLAKSLAASESADIDWWRLRDDVPTAGRLLLSAAVGAALGSAGLFPLWQVGAGIGIGFGFLPAAATSGRHPLRTPLTLRGRGAEMVVLLLVGALGGLAGGIAFESAWPGADGLFFSARGRGSPSTAAGTIGHLMLGGFFGVLLSRLSAMSLAGSPADLEGAASPHPLPSHALRSLVLGGAAAAAGGVVFGTTGAFVLGVAAGCAGGLMAALEASVDMTTAATPVRLLAIDRRNTLFEMVSLGCATAVAVGIVGVERLGLADGVALGIGVGVVVGVGNASAGTAWGHWTFITRPWFAIASPVPVGIMGFLRHAHALGVLRQAGPSYQFRHVRLQDYLLTRAGSRPRSSARTASTDRN